MYFYITNFPPSEAPRWLLTWEVGLGTLNTLKPPVFCLFFERLWPLIVGI